MGVPGIDLPWPDPAAGDHNRESIRLVEHDEHVDSRILLLKCKMAACADGTEPECKRAGSATGEKEAGDGLERETGPGEATGCNILLTMVSLCRADREEAYPNGCELDPERNMTSLVLGRVWGFAVQLDI